MPKPPLEAVFEVTYRISVEKHGATIAALIQAGVEDIDQKLVHVVPAYKKNATPEVSSLDFASEWIKEHPTFKAVELVKAMREDGRGNGTSAYGALNALCEKKILKRVAPGEYARADQKALPAPKKAAKKEAAPDRREVDHRTFLLRVASRNHGRFNTAWMKVQFDKDGRKPGNVSPTVAALLTKKLIKRVGDSEYVLMQKREKEKATPPKANGNGSHIAPAAEEGVTNG